MSLATTVVVDVDHGANVVLLPGDQARALANEQTPPDANNRWIWRANGTPIDDAAFGPPSLHITQPIADATYDISRAPTSPTDTRPLPPRPQRRWQLRVNHRHYTAVLAPGITHQPLRETNATRWIHWRAPPEWPALLTTLNARLADFRGKRPDAANEAMLYTLLRMTLREADGAWLWKADPTQSLHANGLPPHRDYASWDDVRNMLGAIALRDVLLWLGAIEMHRGSAIEADAGLWLAEKSDGTVLAAYEVFALGQHALPMPMMAANLPVQRLSDSVSLVQVPLDTVPPPVQLNPAAPPTGAMRWYRVPIPNSPAPWDGSATQMHALISGMCVHCAPVRLAESPQYTVDVADMLATVTGAGTLLAGDTVAFAVLGFAELDNPPPEMPAGLAIEPDVVIPRRTQELVPARYDFDVGTPPAPPQPAFSTLAWRQFVGGVVVVAFQPLPQPAPIVAPIATPIAGGVSMRPFEPYTPPPLTAGAPDPAIGNGVMLYRVWRGRESARRMLAAFAARKNLSPLEAARALGKLDLSQLREQAFLFRAISGDHDAIWMPTGASPEIIAPMVLENVPMFGNDCLDPAFVLWLIATALAPVDIDTMGNNLPDATLRHMAREHTRITYLLRAQRAARRLTAWLIEHYNSLDATDTPLAAVLNSIATWDRSSAAIVAHIRARLHTYAAAAVARRPKLRYPPRDNETADAYESRITVEMLEPTVVANALAMIDVAAAEPLRDMLELPIALFPAHWTVADLHRALPLGGNPVSSLRAAYYVGPGKSLEDADDDEYDVVGNNNLVTLLHLSADDPTKRTHDERQRVYDKWRDVFIEQADAAYGLTGQGAPRPLVNHAPTASAWLAAMDAMPVPPAVLRTLRDERPTRLAALAPHEARIRMLHTPNGNPTDTPPVPAFFRSGGWSNPALSTAARRYFAEYRNIVRSYAFFALATTNIGALNREWAALERIITDLADTRDREMHTRAAAAIRAPITTNAQPGAPPTTPGAPPTTPGAPGTEEPPLPAFSAAALAWLMSIVPILDIDNARKRIAAQLNDHTLALPDDVRRQVIDDIIGSIASVAPPPPARLSAKVQIMDRYRHMLLIFADGIGPSPSIEAKLANERMPDDAHAAFLVAGRNAAAGIAATVEFESIDDFRAMHQTLWRAGMKAAIDSMPYRESLLYVLGTRSTVLPPSIANTQSQRLTQQVNGSFFRPHPREASFLSAALNTLTMADPDATRDLTSLQRAVWKDRIEQLDAEAQQPQKASLRWTASERKQMLLARKTPEMLARIALRWSMRDFVARGPEARFIVPPLVLERLLWALLESPDFYDARERYGLDPLETTYTLAPTFVATWRTDVSYEVVSDATATALLTLTADAAPTAMSVFAQLANRLQMGATMLWRRTLFGWSTAPSVAITRELDVRTAAELALFAVALDQQVTAAAKTMSKDDATLIESVDRVALLHVCFAWFVAYVMPATGRIFVQRRHPDGHVLYDDFAAIVVPILMREVYNSETMSRTPIDAEWRLAWTRLTGGWLAEDLALQDSRDMMERFAIRPVLDQQRQLLWRYIPAIDPLNPNVPLSAGAVSLYTRYNDDLRDISPLSAISRVASTDDGNYWPEGRDIVYNEQYNDFVPNPAYAFYEWRVGQDCFLRPSIASETRILKSPNLVNQWLDIDAVEFWPDDTPVIRWFERWCARGWHRRPSSNDAAAVLNGILTNAMPALLPPDDEPDVIVYTQAFGPEAAQNNLRERIKTAIQAARRAAPNPGLPLKIVSPLRRPPLEWPDENAVVIEPAYVLLDKLDEESANDAGGYTDAKHEAYEKQVDTLVRGIELYTTFFNHAADVVATFQAELPTFGYIMPGT